MTPTGAPVMSSPVVSYNTQLGETLIFIGNQAGDFEAVDQATGDPVWSDALGSAINSSALAEGNSVWVAPTAANRFYKLNAATGAVQCSAPTPAGFIVDASPQIATPPGGVPTVYLGVNDEGASERPDAGHRREQLRRPLLLHAGAGSGERRELGSRELRH